MNYVYADAVISTDARHRYVLRRGWGECATNPKPLVWAMLNPSTADGRDDDNTIRKIVGFSDRWGYNELSVVNVNSFRCTDPADLRIESRMAATMNLQHIEQECRDRLVIVAWGAAATALPTRNGVARIILRVAADVRCFALTKTGEPVHPLYQRNEAQTFDFVQIRKSWHDQLAYRGE